MRVALVPSANTGPFSRLRLSARSRYRISKLAQPSILGVETEWPATAPIYSHAKLVNIDRQLLRCDMLNRIARRFHVSPDAAGRHRRHMRTAMLKAQAAGKSTSWSTVQSDSRLCRTSPLGLAAQLFRRDCGLQSASRSFSKADAPAYAMRSAVEPFPALDADVAIGLVTSGAHAEVEFVLAGQSVRGSCSRFSGFIRSPSCVAAARRAVRALLSKAGMSTSPEDSANRSLTVVSTRQQHGIMSQGLRQKTD
jgi:hypothetical protein